MRGKPTRVFIEFVKTDGTKAGTWESAPNYWRRMGVRQQEAWVAQAAKRRHPGARDAVVTEVEET